MRLFLYILREYLKYVVGTVLLTVFLFVLFDFINRSTKYFAEHQAKSDDILRFYLYQIPGWVMLALPIAGLLASVICMILLSRTNEITAMRAAGMGALRIGAPLAAGGLILSAGSILLAEVVVPMSAQRFRYVEQVVIEGDDDEQLADEARWTRNGSTLVNFRDYDPLTQTLTGLHLMDLRANFRPLRSIEADSAVFDMVSGNWRLEGIKTVTFRPNGQVERVEDTHSYAVALPIEPAKLRRDRRKSSEKNLKELRDLVARGERSGADVMTYRLEYHGKFAYPFAALVVSLVGLRFGYKSERATETAKGVIIAFLIGICYWLVQVAGRGFGGQGKIPPVLAAWAPNAVVLGIIAFDAWVAKRGN